MHANQKLSWSSWNPSLILPNQSFFHPVNHGWRQSQCHRTQEEVYDSWWHCVWLNKTSGSHGIPAELFQILKDDAVKVLHSICQQIWKTQQWPQDWKRSVFIPIPKKGNAKKCSNYCTISLISHASKVMLKILQARLQQYLNCELPDVQAGLEKTEEPEIKLPTSNGSSEKQESSRKSPVYTLLTLPKPLTVWIPTVENSSRDGHARPPDLPPEKSVCRSRSNS